MKPTIVVSGINLFQGGTLTVYYNFCDEIIESKLYEKYHFILFVHKLSLFEKYQSYFEIIANRKWTITVQNHVKAGLKECIMSIRTLKNILKTKISIYGFQFMT